MEKEEREMMVELIEEIFADKKDKKKTPHVCDPSIFSNLATTIKRVKGYKIIQQNMDGYVINDPVFNFISDVWLEITAEMLLQLAPTIDERNKIAQELHDKGYRITKEESVTA